MPHFAKPAEGSWTEHYPELGTGPVSYADSISPEFYEQEREAIFGRTWLNVGRLEQLAKAGSYFTKELDAAGTSIVVVRGMDGEVARVPQHLPSPRQQARVGGFPARGDQRHVPPVHVQVPRLALLARGRPNFVQQEDEFFDLDKADYPLASVQCEIWEGFIFVNLDESNTTPLREYMGEFGKGLEGYPFHEMTQVHKYRAEIGANWKLFIDAFAEFYHAPVLHAKQSWRANRQGPGPRLRSARVRNRRSARHGVVVGRHGATQGLEHGEADRAFAAQRSVRSVGRA